MPLPPPTPARCCLPTSCVSAKRNGFSDRYLATKILHLPETEVRAARIAAGMTEAWEGVHVSSHG